MAEKTVLRTRTGALSKYGLCWSRDMRPLDIEMEMIRRGGRWQHTFSGGAKAVVGEGLLYHFLALRKIIWPERYEHRWTRLIYEEIIQNQITVLMGSASSQKTSHTAEWLLLDYWCHAENTFVLMSTVTREKLELAIYGECKMLFQKGKERFPDLAGHLIDGRQAICTDSLDDDGVRDMRRGIAGRALYVGKAWVGLGSYAGVKQERMRWMADECQFCAPALLGALPNLRSNTGSGGLKVILSGNPRHDPDDQLGMAAEPQGGWSEVQDIVKTTCWPTKFWGGRCVNLVGIDSPNLDTPEGQPEPYPRLIGREFIKIIEHDYGRNSPEFETQVMGRMRLGLNSSKIITRKLCADHHAHDQVIWLNNQRTRVYGLDPAYGGGDRCVARMGEFGKDIKGQTILFLHPPKTLKLSAIDPRDIEVQIADQVGDDLEQWGIPVENCFYDSFGKGTVGFAFARKFGTNSPVPVDAGGRPSRRPVREDLYIFDETTKQKRLKRCDEHYSKFVTELWFSVRYAIEAEQLRGLDQETMLEGCLRQYETVAGAKIEAEPKDELKERMGKSPDLFDCLAILVEGARQRGFAIGGLVNQEAHDNTWDWLDDLRKRQNSLRTGWALNYKC